MRIYFSIFNIKLILALIPYRIGAIFIPKIQKERRVMYLDQILCINCKKPMEGDYKNWYCTCSMTVWKVTSGKLLLPAHLKQLMEQVRECKTNQRIAEFYILIQPHVYYLVIYS